MFSFCLMPQLLFAQNLGDAFKTEKNTNLGTVAEDAGYNPGQENTFDNIVATIIKAALSLLGVIFIALTVYAGYLWMTARGDEATAAKAKNILTMAIIGLVIVVLAYAISIFVITKLGAATLKPA